MSGLTQTQVDSAKNLACESCNNEVFKQTYVIKKISGLLTDNGKEMMAPIPIFSCAKCGNVNKVFVDDLKINVNNNSKEIIQHVQV